MKDQYFGDFGDYQKISLLNILKNKGLKVCVHWMKTHDDQSGNGAHIQYLKNPSKWRGYEPAIFDFIQKKLSSGKRLISHIEKSPYSRGIEFVSAPIDKGASREKLLASICLRKNSDMVFFDPNNGIEVKSTNAKNAHKYVSWNEIISSFQSGKSLLIYQHFSRSSREALVKNKMKELRKRVGAPVFALRVKHSVYLFVLQKKHAAAMKSAAKDYLNIWKDLAIMTE